MKKKSLTAITILLILALSLTGCGKKTNNTPNTSGNPTQTEKADASGAYEETEVDMEKVDGNEITSMTEKNDYDGICSLLDELKKMEIKIAVCSNKPDNVVHFVTDNIFGKNYFDAVCGVIDGMPVKPDPYTPLKIASELGVTPEDCLFLGDTNVDIITAKNAGMTSVGVLWGFRTRTELVQARADYIAENPHTILQLI